MKIIIRVLCLLILQCSYGQIVQSNRVTKRIENKGDTIQIGKVAISPYQFKIFKKDSIQISKEDYFIDFNKSVLFIQNDSIQNITIEYFKYPDFITQNYSPYPPEYILTPNNNSKPKYIVKQEFTKENLFGDLQTYGNITRGITLGNNQGSVLTSGLDLQVHGKLSKELNIRASIKDSSLPIQENGVSQNINEFDRVFMELYTDQWNLTAGDVDLVNQESYFMSFTKKITGAKVDVSLDHDDSKTTITASGALVKGRFVSQSIRTLEGNQGPYQLIGPNGEQNIIVISGSENVYVNGIRVKRGEHQDYTIDYFTGEITFNPTFPINASQRIIVEFQFNDRDYNRFITYDGVKHQGEKFNIATYFYNENDIKSQPIQQTLDQPQVEALKNAGNDLGKMITQSATLTNYDENRIQYEKVAQENDSIFVFSTNQEAKLYNVQFNFVGVNQGNYQLKETTAIGKIYEYVGNNNGSFNPVILLSAPTRTQVAIVQAGYKWGEKSNLQTEVAYSNNDQNLFSNIDDENNQGLAAKVQWQQNIKHQKWDIVNTLNIDHIQKNFNNIEGLYNVEFNRDWNIQNAITNTLSGNGNQNYITNYVTLQQDSIYTISVGTEYLSLSNRFKGFKQKLNTFFKWDKANLSTSSSFLQSDDVSDKGSFLRNYNRLNIGDSVKWVKTDFSFERNDLEDKNTKIKNNINQQLINGGLVLGIGDSTKVYTAIGYHRTLIDSIRNNQFTRVQAADNYSLNSQWIKTKKSNLSAAINYRKAKNSFRDNQEILNGRLQYGQTFFKGILRWNTLYETSSGNTPQQDFTYIETEQGQGFYTYLGDLNNNGTKDFNEFEVAQFQDQANYLRVALPNINNVATQKAKISQSIWLNFVQFQNSKNNWLKGLSHFSNQTNFIIDNNQTKTTKTFNLNPFNTSAQNILSLRENFRTSIFFNRGLQFFSTTYSYLQNKASQTFTVDTQTQENQGHEVDFQHRLHTFWLFDLKLKSDFDSNTSTTFDNRNFDIQHQEMQPSLSFLKNDYSKLQALYIYKTYQNKLDTEELNGHEMALNYEYNKLDKSSVLANFTWIENNYKGNINTPAAYRILEGLQPGRNFTWSLIIQKKLTKLLDLNLTYNGRKDEFNKAIHTGSVQLRANF